MRSVAHGLAAVAIAGTLSLAPAACGLPDPPSPSILIGVDSAGTPVQRSYFVCGGGSDSTASVTMTAAAGDTVSTPGSTTHRLIVPPGALSANAVVHISDAYHPWHMKVRVGTSPSQTLADSVTLTFDLTRCEVRPPSSLELVREDNATWVGSALVVGSQVTFSITELSTYVLAAPGRK